MEIQVFGKTYLSNCIAKEILDNNKTVLYQTAPNMLDNIISYRFGNNDLKNYYKINKSEEVIISEVLHLISDYYMYEVKLMPGFKEFISNYDSVNVIGTSCDEELVKIALIRLGVLNYFEDIITCSKVNKSKDDPDFYLACAGVLKQKPKDIVVFEDADYCIDVARKAGFKVVKIKDWRDLDEKCIDDCGK